VQMELGDVFAREGMGRGKPEYEPAIDQCAVGEADIP